jgi:hypothetical protein
MPSNASVPVVSGTQISFEPAGGSTVYLYFSPDLVSALSPGPNDGSAVALTETASFAFTTSDPGVYVVMASNSANESPNFEDAESNHVHVTTMLHRLSGGLPFPPGTSGDPGSIA